MRKRLLEHVHQKYHSYHICCQNLTSFGDVTMSHRKPICPLYILRYLAKGGSLFDSGGSITVASFGVTDGSARKRENLGIVGSLYQYHIYISYYLTNNTKYKFFLSLFIQNNQMTGYYEIVLKNCMQSLFVHLLCTFFYILQMNNSFYRNVQISTFINRFKEIFLKI